MAELVFVTVFNKNFRKLTNHTGAGSCPLFTKGRVWEGAVPPSQKMFDILISQWRIFVKSLVLNFVFLRDQKY